MRDTFLRFHVPDIEAADIAAVADVLRSGWLTTGARAKQFERDFAAYIGTPHAVAVNSCTAALHLALEAVGVRAGDEVIVPTMTFAATAAVVTHLGARPVLADCLPDTLNLDPDDLERRVTRRTKAIVPVHMAGHPCDMDGILDIAAHHRLFVIEDAAHALPSCYKGRRVGAIGDVTCFSFYATKTITTGEGGMATTADGDLAARMRLMSLHGISTDAWNRYAAEGSWRYDIVHPGFKYNLSDIAAALGIEQLKKCHRLWLARQQIADRYDRGLGGLTQIELPTRAASVQHAWHLYAIRLRPEQLTISRDAFVEALKKRNIGTSVHFIPLHLHPHYRSQFGYRPEDFPAASAEFERIVSLPIFPGMTDADVDDVIEAVREVIAASVR
jgi:perosamine synthetase